MHVAVYDEKVVFLRKIYKVNDDTAGIKAQYDEDTILEEVNEILKQAVVRVAKKEYKPKEGEEAVEEAVEEKNFDFSKIQRAPEPLDLLAYPFNGIVESSRMRINISGLDTALPETEQDLFLIPQEVTIYLKDEEGNIKTKKGLHVSPFNYNVIKTNSPHLWAHEIFHTWHPGHVTEEDNLMQEWILPSDINLTKSQWDLPHKQNK